MKKKYKKIPKFKNEKEERAFWQKADSSKYVDYSKARRVRYPNLKLSSRPITIRLQRGLLERVKLKANQMDMPYQTLIKQMINSGLRSL